VPRILPFRALRYSPEVVADLAAVVAPPYDVIEPDEHARLLARDPRNVVRLDLPAEVPGEDPDERYRRASRLLSTWRSDGTLHRDPRPSLYAYEQTFVVPGTTSSRVRRGLFARVGLEPFGPGSGIRPHERTLSGPKEDRYRLLRATNVNTSPIVGVYEDPSGAVPARLVARAATPPLADLVDADGIRHRLWAIATTGEADDPAAELAARIGAGPITIADGHHRYETALRYRDERRVGRVPSDDDPWESVLMLLLEPVAGPLTVLPTHRVLLGLGPDGLAALLGDVPKVFEATPASADALRAAFGPGADAPGGRGRFGLWTRDRGWFLDARRDVLDAWLPPGGAALRHLDVALLGAALERALALDPTRIAEGGRMAYTKDAADAIARVSTATDGADAAFLLEPTPASAMIAVAADGDVMPQKSTYIHPKAITGLVINPLE